MWSICGSWRSHRDTLLFPSSSVLLRNKNGGQKRKWQKETSVLTFPMSYVLAAAASSARLQCLREMLLLSRFPWHCQSLPAEALLSEVPLPALREQEFSAMMIVLQSLLPPQTSSSFFPPVNRQAKTLSLNRGDHILCDRKVTHCNHLRN